MKTRDTIKQIECYLVICVLIIGFLGKKVQAQDYEPVSHGTELDGCICKHGYHTFGDRYLKIGSRKRGSKPCFISSGFSSSERSKINSAITVWNNQFAKKGIDHIISLKNITDSSVAAIKIKSGYLGNSTYGRTSFFDGGEQLVLKKEGDKLKSNYSSCVIQINTTLTGINKLKKTMVHELGHVLGLSHRTCAKGIMFKWSVDKVASVTPDNNAISAIKHIYC